VIRRRELSDAERAFVQPLPPRSERGRSRLRRGSRGGRPPAFGKQVYKRRNVVERCFNRLKQCRGIATRYDKTTESCPAAATLASLLMRAWGSSMPASSSPPRCRYSYESTLIE
jgi:transposase